MTLSSDAGTSFILCGVQKVPLCTPVKRRHHDAKPKAVHAHKALIHVVSHTLLHNYGHEGGVVEACEGCTVVSSSAGQQTDSVVCEIVVVNPNKILGVMTKPTVQVSKVIASSQSHYKYDRCEE